MDTRGSPSALEQVARTVVASLARNLGEAVTSTILVGGSLLLAIPIFAGFGVILVVVDSVLGHPGDGVAAVLSIGWFVASLVATFLVLRRSYRWIRAVSAIPDTLAASIDPPIPMQPTSLVADARPLEERLAEADARLSPRSGGTDTAAPEPRR